jgi:dipeptidyl-peptidase-4
VRSVRPVFAVRASIAIAFTVGVLQISSSAQDRLPAMPGYQQYQKVSTDSRDAVKSGALTVSWKDPNTFEYQRDGKLYRYDVSAKAAVDAGEAPAPAGRGGRGGRGGGQGAPERGRQFDSAESPDKKFRAVYRDRNVYMVDVATNAEVAVTTDGSENARTKNVTYTHLRAHEN